MIDNTPSYKHIGYQSYFRLNYENDVFSATDKYYTQGIHLEVVAPWVIDFPISKLLIHPHFSSLRYGIGLEHNGYTPTSISNPAILYGDRPFTATLALKSFLLGIDPAGKQRFTSSIYTGVIGQSAGGMEMQTAIHRWLNNITPHGWPNQIHNDVVLNYQMGYEKQLISVGHVFAMDADAQMRVGTLSDKAGVGTTLMGGYFHSPYATDAIDTRQFSIYAYEHAEVNVIGYDATLQGGIFNRTSPYTLSAGDLSHATFQNRFGFVVSWQGVCLEYFQSLLSREFKTGDFHVWGGVQVAIGL